MELPEKIENILAAYLQTGTYPDWFTDDLIHPGESDVDKTTQVIQAVCGTYGVEDPPYSGNLWFTVQIELRTPITLQTDDEKASADDTISTAQIDKHKAVATVLSNLIVITDLPAQLNTIANAQADVNLQAFAAIGFTDRQHLREQNDAYIMSGFNLRLYACSNAAAQ